MYLKRRWRWVLIFPVLMSILLLLYFLTPLPQYPVELKKVKLLPHVNDFEGTKLATAICVSCHYDPVTQRLSGIRHGNPSKFGVIYSANITQDSTYGIGKWTDKELAYFLRTGIRKDGSYVFDMPKYALLSNEDISSIIAFLRSDNPLVRPVSKSPGITQYSFLSKILLKFYFRPLPYVYTPDSINKNDPILWGKYLATVKYSCADCHSYNSLTYVDLEPEKSFGYFKGGNPHYDEHNNRVLSASLRPVRKFTKTEFTLMVRDGIRKDGSLLKRPMIPFSMLDTSEVNAIYFYLHSLDNGN